MGRHHLQILLLCVRCHPGGQPCAKENRSKPAGRTETKAGRWRHHVFRDRFTRIYATKMWGQAGGGSGDGSTLEYTANVRRHLLDVLSRYNVTSMLDSYCGSMIWMSLVLRQRQQEQPGFRFMGTDVVCNLTEQHKVTYANESNWQFQCVDYSAQPLPSGYDLVWSRDSLQHVPLHGTWQFLNNVRASGAKYLLVGSYVKNTEKNVDIVGGDYFPLDLLKPPFNASQHLEVFDEQTDHGKHMLLFDVQNMTWDDSLLGLV